MWWHYFGEVATCKGNGNPHPVELNVQLKNSTSCGVPVGFNVQLNSTACGVPLPVEVQLSVEINSASGNVERQGLTNKSRFRQQSGGSLPPQRSAGIKLGPRNGLKFKPILSADRSVPKCCSLQRPQRQRSCFLQQSQLMKC